MRIQMRRVFYSGAAFCALSVAATAAGAGPWSGYVDGLSKYVCQEFATECSGNAVMQADLHYDLGQDAIGTGGRNALNVWSSFGDGGLADEVDLMFSERHDFQSATGHMFWVWRAGYIWLNYIPGTLWQARDNFLKFDTHLGQQLDLGTWGGVHLSAAPSLRLYYMRGLGLFPDATDAGVELPLHVEFPHHWFGSFFIAHMWNLQRHYRSPTQLRASFGYHLNDHWSVYAKYVGVKANGLTGSPDVDVAGFGGGISFTGL